MSKKGDAGWKVVTAVFSALALLISGTSAYINTFRKLDELTILIDEPPKFGLTFSGPSPEISVSPYFDAILINSGNRSLVVLNLRVELFDEKFVGGDPKCIYGRKMPTDFKPLVLKEKDVERMRVFLNVGPNGGWRAQPSIDFGSVHINSDEKMLPIMFSMPDDYRSTHKYAGSLCLVISWATPRESGETPIMISKNDGEKITEYVGKGFQPAIITRKITSIFELD